MSDTIRVNVVEDAPVSVNVSDAVNYNYVTNKPSINGVELVGNKTSEDLHIQGDLWELIAENTDDTTPVSRYVINKDTNNNDFALKKFMLLQVAPRTDGGTNNKLYLFMNMTGNTVDYSAMSPLQTSTGSVYTYTRFKFIGERFSEIPTWIINTTNTDFDYIGGNYAGGIYNTKFGCTKHNNINDIATSFILSANSRTTTTTNTVAVKWQLWGVRV